MTTEPFSHVGIVGAGAMGAGIAQVIAQSGRTVLLFDAQPGAADRALAGIRDGLAGRVAKGKLTDAEAAAIVERIAPVDTLIGLAKTGLVIEAIIENVAAKQDVFAVLEDVCDPTAVFATNTSSLSVREIGAKLVDPDRMIGLHFFNPAPVMKLVEVIGPEGLADAQRAAAVAFVETLGKTPVLCADSPGFIVNRCARPFYGEALCLLEEGRHTPHEIDLAMVDAGYRMGPFALIDLVGADVNLAATQSMAAAFDDHPRYRVFDVLADAVAAGRLGRKTGAGFVTPAPETPPTLPADAGAIVARIEAAMVNEAHFALAQAIATADGIDTAVKLGLNFPRGPFEMLDNLGIDAVRDTLRTVQAAAPAPWRARYDLAPALA